MNRRPFLAFAIAETLSISGTRLSTIAIPWLVLTTTGSPILTGVVAMAEMLPYVVAKALSGPLIDRIGPKRVAIGCDTASVLVVGLVPLLALFGWLDLALLLPIVVAMGILRGPSDAAKISMVPSIAKLADVPLERVTGVAGVIDRLASTVGAAAAGGLIALIGPGLALTLNAATFALAAAVVATGIPAFGRERTETRGSYFAELREGFDFIRRDALLVGIVVMITITNLLDAAWSAVLLPVWTQQAGFDAALLGLLFAVMSAASIAGAAIATATGERLPRLTVYIVAFLLAGLPRFAVFAIDVPLLAVFVTLAIGGFAAGFINPIVNAVIMERIPPAMIGRASALVGALAWALIPFGGLVGGALVALVGLAPTLWLTGLAYFAATLLPLARRSFRAFGSRPGAEAA
ncbi:MULTISPECIES: MFS transporter [unclassified Devosia]|uniref:MFS transporter n=1 Tax=unclassified Devosia TaxID=196773 RepID=UPI00086E23F2|nr:MULTISPECIES: MFS transporter [unclassified Devosia]MBN9360499.1 MFS transporter [Devosia sp.]ODS94677.1 MAG: MFS transporter permease [Devosia sp. SCN 66-27]OJX22498.1 MAG: MFS transporter [Devosia sp. 66-14]